MSDNTPLSKITPRDGFRFFAASANMNLPAMYAHGHAEPSVTVVTQIGERTFPMSRFDEAIAWYRIALEELGYFREPGDIAHMGFP